MYRVFFANKMKTWQDNYINEWVTFETRKSVINAIFKRFYDPWEIDERYINLLHEISDELFIEFLNKSYGYDNYVRVEVIKESEVIE